MIGFELITMLGIIAVTSLLMAKRVPAAGYIAIIAIVIALLLIIGCVIVNIKENIEELKQRKKNKFSDISTYNITDNISLERNLAIFKNSIPDRIEAQWKSINMKIEYLQEVNFHTEIFDEVNKILNNIVVRSVINGKVSNESIKDFEDTLNSYSEYVTNQINQYHMFEKRQIENVQPYLDLEYKKLKGMLNSMNEDII